eukprot:268666_1
MANTKCKDPKNTGAVIDSHTVTQCNIPQPPPMHPPLQITNHLYIPTDFSDKIALQRGLSKTQFFGNYLIDSKIIGQGSFAVVPRFKRVPDEMILAMKPLRKRIFPMKMTWS